MSADEQQQPRVDVESAPQQSGITAYQVDIQPGDRQLTDASAQQLKNFMDDEEFNSIEVTAVMGDGESFRFASQVKNFLASAGFKVTGVTEIAYSAPVRSQAVEPPNDAGVVRVIIGNR